MAMKIDNISIGCIIENTDTNTRYRLIGLNDKDAVMCQMDITKLVFVVISAMQMLELIGNGVIKVQNDDDVIFNINKLSGKAREQFELKRNIMNEVNNLFGPYYAGLMSKKAKPELKDILLKYNYSKASFWRMALKYYQSGMKDYSLVDGKVFGANKGKQYNITTKTGRPTVYGRKSGIIITDEIEKYFSEALADYKKGRQKSFRSAFDRMNLLHFCRVNDNEGVSSVELFPPNERPTYAQFYYYCKKHITKKEMDIVKTSAMEYRNDNRLITSDIMQGVYGPGDMVEIDACEADVSLVSTIDKNRTVGRPVVYFMIDIYTRIILAVSVAFDNNSILGVTNLFINLADDKHEYCQKYGLNFDDEKLWPSNIIPKRLRVDRGAEFKSKEFGRICNELGIEKQIVPGGSGSLKGVVEQSFHQMHSSQNEHLENYGLIEKRHDSKHHKESTLTIDDYTKMVINFVLMHNQQYDKNYHITKDMLNNKVQPVPAELWQYGVGKYGSPRPIKDRTQYLFNLMTPVNARISRRGISYDGLWYIAEHDAELANDMIKTGKKRVPFEVRIDKRDVGAVYYIRNNRLIKAQLNKRIAGNAEYAGMTMKEWDDIRNLKKQMDAEGKIYNEELSAFNYEINDRIVSSAKKEFYSDQHDMREARETEKQLVSSEGKIADKLDDDKQKQIMDLQNKEDKPLNNENVPQTFEEAFKMYFND